jgi:dipeptidyl aminopeptidase/acylaminoacyl peptidase
MSLHRLGFGLAVLALAWSPVPFTAQQAARGRALTIEDYYRVQSVGGVSIAPNGKWVAFTVSTRLEEPETNSSRSDAWIVPADASAAPRRIQHQGKDVTNPSWTDDSWLQILIDGGRWKVDPDNPSTAPLRSSRAAGGEGRGGGGRGGRGGGGRGGGGAAPSPDGKFEAATVNKPQPEAKPTYASDFEKRHQERFKGAIFDWKDFQRDGAPFPAPNPVAQPAQQIVLRPRPATAGGVRAGDKVLVDMDLRPGGLAWHPNGQVLAFAADPDWRNELKYASPDLWTVTIDGKVTRVTNDGYVYGDVDYSPDGKHSRTRGRSAPT